MNTSLSIKDNLNDILKRIRLYEAKYHREAGSVKLLAVSKQQFIEKTEEAYEAGQCAFGENYVQEALTKIHYFEEKNHRKKIEWHFIGTIQKNKTRKIAEYFSWVHSVASQEIAQRLNDQRPAHLPPLCICLEVNLNEEETKSGVLASEVLPLAKFCQTLPRLQLRGLMAIPLSTTQPEMQRKIFRLLFLLKEKLQAQGIPLDTLSMGMSHDFEAAIAEGSTIVRIGTAIFGERHIIP